MATASSVGVGLAAWFVFTHGSHTGINNAFSAGPVNVIAQTVARYIFYIWVERDKRGWKTLSEDVSNTWRSNTGSWRRVKGLQQYTSVPTLSWFVSCRNPISLKRGHLFGSLLVEHNFNTINLYIFVRNFSNRLWKNKIFYQPDVIVFRLYH